LGHRADEQSTDGKNSSGELNVGAWLAWGEGGLTMRKETKKFKVSKKHEDKRATRCGQDLKNLAQKETGGSKIALEKSKGEKRDDSTRKLSR